jgi:hypothetical protein
MRQVLVNHAEANLTEKRGGWKETISLEDADPAVWRQEKRWRCMKH